MKIRELSKEELIEESFVDLTYAMLEETHETKTYAELVEEIEKLLNLSKEEMKDRLVQFYTDLNIDGRFLILGENRWGLREWYPVEQIEEESAPTVKARKKKAKVADDEGFDDLDELALEDELEFEDFGEDDDDDEDDDDEVIKSPVEVEVLDFDADDEDEEDVDVLVEDLDGNIIDDEDEDEDEDDEDEEDDLK